MTVFWKRLVLVAIVGCPPAMATAEASVRQQTSTKQATAPAGLKKAVGCLVSASYVREYGLKPLGLKAGDRAWVRYHVGSLSGMDPTPGEYYVAVYAADGRSGELLEAIPNRGGGFEAVRNGYRLRRRGNRWIADEGQGGYMDYRAFGDLATKLGHESRYRVRLIVGGPECTVEAE